ncbi:MAG TPA: GTPase, partial [Gemmataceae bacterium]
KKAPKKGGVSHKIPRQGAGQVLLLGAPNAGKSSVLAKLSKASPEVAPYPFTTREPAAGMVQWEDVRYQVIDLPPVTADFFESYISDMLQAADAAVLLLDLADDDGPFAAEAVLEQLAAVKKRLVGEPPAEPEPTVCYRKALLVANKIDAEGAADRLEVVREMFGDRFPVHVISAERGDGMEELRKRMYDLLGVMRIYSKMPGKPPDLSAPFTCPLGSTVAEFAGVVHQDFAEKARTAKVWGTGVFDGQTVGRDHVLHDRDIVELHL